MELSVKVQEIKDVATELEKSLISYKSKATNPNHRYIDKQTSNIANLRQAAETFSELEPLDIWLELLTYFKHYQGFEKDGFIIYLPFKANPRKERFIIIDFTKTGGACNE